MNNMQRICLVAYALASAPSIAQVPLCTHYQGDFCFGGVGNDYLDMAIGTSDGNVVMLGNIADGGGGNINTTRYGGTDALVMKVAPDGTPIWSRVYGGSSLDALTWIAELPDGGFLVAGLSRSNDGDLSGPPLGGGSFQGWYMRLDPDGMQLWTKHVVGTALIADVHFIKGALMPGGAILANYFGPGIRIDLDGNIELSSDQFRGRHITAGSDGSFLLTRTIWGPSTGIFAGEPAPIGPTGNTDIGIVNLNADATINWAHRFIAPSDDSPWDLEALSGGYMIHGVCRGALGGDRMDPGPGAIVESWVIRADLAGDIVWERSLGPSSVDQSGHMSMDSDGGVLVFGRTLGPANGDVSESSNGDADAWVCKLDGTGTKLWDKRWGGSLTEEFREAIPVPAGYLLIGSSNSPRSGDHHHPGFIAEGWDIWMVQMYPGTPTFWYFDYDGDGFGDGCCPNDADGCVQPDNFVDNGWDCDDLFPNLSSEYLGAPCNDGDWHTINDVFQPGCVCAGTFVDVSDLTPVTVTLWPDFDPGETTWELRDMATQQIAMQGGPYPNGQQGVPESATVMIPPVCNQRFQLFVYDGQSNGMQGGRYTLTAGDKRLIDSDGAFQQVSTVSSQLLPIDLPLGGIALTSNICDRLDLLPTSVITCSEAPAVSLRYDLRESDTGYQFWIFDPHGSYSRRVFQSHKNPGKGGGSGATKPCYLKLNSLVTNPVPQQVLLNVRVRTQIQGIYGAFGPACTMKIDPAAVACPTTQLVNSPNDPHHSCGLSYMLNGSQRIWAYAKPGVNKYQFQFSDIQSNYVRHIAGATPTVLMTVWATNPLQYQHLYNVRVRCSTNGGQTWCAWGPSCEINTVFDQALPLEQRGVEAIDVDREVTLFPNPTSERSVRVQFGEAIDPSGSAHITLYDATGRVVMNVEMAIPTLFEHPLALPSALMAGTYLFTIELNGSRYHERLVLK